MSATSKLRLGNADVSRIGLGTNRLDNTSASVDFVRAAVTAGVSHIDTAHTYTGGDSEKTIGAALSPLPEGCVVATKGGWNGARPEVLAAEIEESLARLRTDSIPLYYLHRPDPEIPIEDSLAAIEEYRRAGRIRHIGLSNVDIDQIERGRAVAPITAVQNHYNLAERRHEEVVDYCAREGIVFVAYFPLRAGGGPPLTEIAERHRATRVQITLAWLLERSPTMVPIPGSLSLEHVKENLGALDIELTAAELQALQ